MSFVQISRLAGPNVSDLGLFRTRLRPACRTSLHCSQKFGCGSKSQTSGALPHPASRIRGQLRESSGSAMLQLQGAGSGGSQYFTEIRAAPELSLAGYLHSVLAEFRIWPDNMSKPLSQRHYCEFRTSTRSLNVPQSPGPARFSSELRLDCRSSRPISVIDTFVIAVRRVVGCTLRQGAVSSSNRSSSACISGSTSRPAGVSMMFSISYGSLCRS